MAHVHCVRCAVEIGVAPMIKILHPHMYDSIDHYHRDHGEDGLFHNGIPHYHEDRTTIYSMSIYHPSTVVAEQEEAQDKEHDA